MSNYRDHMTGLYIIAYLSLLIHQGCKQFKLLGLMS